MSLLKTKQIPIVNETVQYNGPNGNDAELFSASNLLLACGAEISWGSRNEDGRKIDLIVSFDHPWYENERLLLLVQVKSGDTYGKVIPGGFILKTAAKKLAQRTSHDICLLWVDRQRNLVYWAYIHPNSSSLTQQYTDIHKVFPAMRYDIARCQARNLRNNIQGTLGTGASGITIVKSEKPLKERREKALNKYTYTYPT